MAERISISVPSGLKARMEAARPTTNWSAVAQSAFEAEVDRQSSGNVPMDLPGLLSFLVTTTPKEWTQINCWGYGSGPSYKGWLVDDEPGEFAPQYHSERAIYLGDFRLSLAWGLPAIKDWGEVRLKKRFPDETMSAGFADIFYNDGLVFRFMYLIVDGVRCYLPVPDLDPESKEYSAPSLYVALVRLINSFTSKRTTFDEYILRAGIAITDTAWPIHD